MIRLILFTVLSNLHVDAREKKGKDEVQSNRKVERRTLKSKSGKIRLVKTSQQAEYIGKRKNSQVKIAKGNNQSSIFT